ncbi:MAG: Mur ligase family protein [Eubacteriales bacterium]|nr:Mur ligase family protein [Eubacteriales bacterium]
MKQLKQLTAAFSADDRDSEPILALNPAAEALLSGASNPEIELVAQDSRRCTNKSIFVAIRGFDHDGHKYLRQAAEHGAVAAFVEEFDESLPELAQIKTEDSRLAFAVLSRSFFDDPSRELHLTGITGSNGKTSTSLFLRSIHTAAAYETGLIGTVVYASKTQEIEAKLTTPDAWVLQGLFRQMIDEGMDHAIMESSSIGQHQQRDRGCDYDVIALINLSHEHIDYHGSYEAYIDAKMKILERAKPEAICILNADNADVMRQRPRCHAEVFTFGASNGADIRVRDLDLSKGYAHFYIDFSERIVERFKLSEDERSLEVQLAVPGEHSVYNALAATGMALASKIRPATIRRGLETYLGVERRFQEVFDGNFEGADFRIFDDHFSNQENIRVTLSTLSKIQYRRLHLLFAVRGKRGATIVRESIEEIAKWAKRLPLESFFATTSQDVVDQDNEVLPEELAALHESLATYGLECEIFEELRPALYAMLDRVKSGDVILLGGAQGIDAGARLLLEELARRHPEWDRERLMAPIRDRVCGQEP